MHQTCSLMLNLLLLLGLIPAAGVLMAQDRGQDDAATIRNSVYAFAEAYSNLTKTRDKESVLRFFSKDLTSNMFYFGINGKARVENSDFPGFNAYLDKVLRSEGLTISYKVADVLRNQVNGNVATITYVVNYEIKEDNGIWVKGNETVSMAFKKIKDEWKAVHFSVMGMEDEKLKGTCICEFFTTRDDDGELVVKTIVPAGKSYTTEFNNFKFKNIDGNKAIRSGEYMYKWMAGGQLVQLNQEGEVINELGKAENKKEAVLSIIRNSIYADNCARIKTLEK